MRGVVAILTPLLFYLLFTAGPGTCAPPASPAEVYQFHQTLISPGEGLPAGSAFCRVKLSAERDSDGQIAGGTAEFQVNLNLDAAIQIHGAQVVCSGGAIDAGTSAEKPWISKDGKGSFSALAKITREDSRAISALRGLSYDPKSLAIVLRLSADPPRTLRAPLVPFIQFVPYVAQAGKTISMVQLNNPSRDREAHVLVKLFDDFGGGVPIPGAGELKFLQIPAGRSEILAIEGGIQRGAAYGQVFSDAAVEIEMSILASGEKSGTRVRLPLAHVVSIPVVIDPDKNIDTILAVQATAESGTHLGFTLADASGADVPKGSDSVELQPGKNLQVPVSKLVPSIAKTKFKGTLTVERRWTSFAAGRMWVLAVQAGTGIPILLPVTVVNP